MKEINKCMNEYFKSKFGSALTTLTETSATTTKTSATTSGTSSGTAMGSTTTTGSGTTTGSLSGTGSMSSSGSGSGSNTSSGSGTTSNSNSGSSSKNSKFEQLDNQKNAQQNFIKFKGLKALADLVKPSVQVIRGTLCVLCMDPAAPVDALWDGTQPIINTAAVQQAKDAIAVALNAVREMAADCKTLWENVVKSTEAVTGVCQAATDVIAAFETSVKPCKDKAACDTLAGESVKDPFTVNGVDAVTGDAVDPTVSSTRRALAATYKADANKGATAQPDATVDDSLEVAPGTTTAGANTGLTTAQTE